MRVERREELSYQPKEADSPLLMLPLSGGAPRQLVGCVKPTAFATGPQGVYYEACDSSPDPALHVIESRDRPRPVLGRLEQYQNDPMFCRSVSRCRPTACRSSI